MPELLAFQRDFAARLLRPSIGRDGFAIYRNNWLHAAVEALADIYPTAVRLIGRDMFEAVAADYVRANPPGSPVLSDYSAGFAEHLGAQGWAAELPYLADVATIDRLHVEAGLAAEARPLDAAELAGVEPHDWIGLRLRLHPATRIGWFATPAATIWLAHRDSDDFVELVPAWRAEGVLITRRQGEVLARPIDRAEHRMLVGMRLGESVGQAAIAALALYPVGDLAQRFACIIESGALAAPQQGV